MEKEFFSAIEQICEERGIAKEKVLETIEMAIAAAYKKEHGRKGQVVRAKLDPATGKTKLFQVKLVVEESMLKPEPEEGEEIEEWAEAKSEIEEELEEVGEEEKKIRFNPEKHIMVDEAKKIDKKLNVGDELLISLEAGGDYGRIAAQTAKQVIIQRIREAEKESIFEEYKNKEGQVVSGIVQRAERGTVFFDLGRGTGFLLKQDQIVGEYYRIGQRFRLYLLKVEKEPQGSVILVSRSHPEMINCLFEIEVPEIAAGTVIIKAVAREAGSRSKIAAASTDEKIDPIGSLVGQKGTRVQAVINELGGEKIDIIQWEEDSAKFIANSLSPAKVVDVEISEKNRRAVVKVVEEQLSLAIGKQGQNVRLAAKLTGWKIDILPVKGKKVETEETEEQKEVKAEEEKKEPTEGGKEMGGEEEKLKTDEKKEKEGKKKAKKKARKTKKSIEENEKAVDG